MNARASRPRTRVLALSDEVQLQRLLRSILAPTGCKGDAAPLSALEGMATARPDVVIADVEPQSGPLVGSNAAGAMTLWLAGKTSGVNAGDRLLLIQATAVSAQSFSGLCTR